MADLFLYGTLRYRALLDLVLEHDQADLIEAELPNHRVVWAAGQSFPLIEAGGTGAKGLLARGLSDEDLARLDYYEGGFGYGTRVLAVNTAEGAQGARVYFPDPGLWQAGAAWDLDAWIAEHGALTLEAATEVMGYHGRLPAKEVAARFPFIRARAWSRLLAQRHPAPQTLRSPAGQAAPVIEDREGGYDGFFRMRPLRANHLRFDGTRSDAVDREAFIAFDAALLLPYDPVRDLVMLVEQFRYGPTLRSDPCTRVLEPIAGMVDAGEDPAQSARREAAEEAGLTVTDIRPIAGVYASPGYSTDFFHCYLGVCDLDRPTGTVAGHPDEDEDIRAHILPFDQAMDLVASGEVNVAPLAMMLLWLARERDGLRADAG